MNRFYEYPKFIQWFVAIILVMVGFGSILLIYLGPWFILLFPFIISIFQFGSTPFFRLTGIYKYYSPMLLVYNPNPKTYDLHNGTPFDYFFVMKRKDAGAKARYQILAYFVQGLLRGCLGFVFRVENESFFA